MYVSDLALTDFRSYRDVVVHLPPGVVVFEGKNGRGKTNLVEALAYLSVFSSHRVASSTPLVRIPRDNEEKPGGAIIRARVQKEKRSHLLELELARGRANRGRLNKSPVPPRQLMGVVRTVVFAPEDLLLLRGDPSVRRRFLDETVTKLKPHYQGIVQEYERVARARGATLKQFGFSRGAELTADQEIMLQVWDEKLAELSADVVVHRLAVVDAFSSVATDVYNAITEDDREAKLTYVSTLFAADGKKGSPIPEPQGRPRVEQGRIVDADEDQRTLLVENFLAQARMRREDELRRGVNLVGAHRDDLLLELDSLPVKGYASHGELWSSALMLRLAELHVLREEEEYPILILDDVFAELDEVRRRRLADLVEGVTQVIITSAVAEDLPKGLKGHHFQVTRAEDGSSVVTDLAQPPGVAFVAATDEAVLEEAPVALEDTLGDDDG